MQNATTKEQAQTATNPVAYLVEHGHTHERLSFYPLTGSEKADGWIETPLYAATAPRAIEAAEGDLLGQALGALELWFQYDDGEWDNGIDLMASYAAALDATKARSEEHTSELQSLMRSSYAGFCMKNTTI